MNGFVNYYKKETGSNLIILLASSPFCDDHEYIYACVSLSYYFAYSTHCIEAIVHSITAENI